MIKAIIGFALAALVLSLINMKIPLFHRRNVLRWEKQTCLQRFCSTFFPSLIVFVICVMIFSYRNTNSPSDMEQKLESGELNYYLVTDAEEIGEADIVFEIKKDSDSGAICKIIPTICKEYNLTEGTVRVSAENGEYIIRENNVPIGNVTVSEKEFGLLLKFKWRTS